MSGDTASHHIVLIGPMGAGKTTLGALVAERLGRPFLDSDRELERVRGSTALAIAESEGVGTLHALEHDVFRSMAASTVPSVIAAAASVVDSEEGRGTLRRAATVWLEADDATLADRAASGSHRRPIDPEGVRQLHADRLRLARDCIAAIIDTTRDPDECVGAIVAATRPTGTTT
jgi:shikimate kinase